ncbi:MAG TPA: FG-GAP-like repeat-containing protein [Thermoanaerobaculia bacterium]|nr:FG-GAP-like repeat-containing protein [Thermoanaerobaculia bacterium]
MRTILVSLSLLLAIAAPTSGADCPSVDFTLDQTLTGYPSYVEHLRIVDYDHDGKLDLVGGITPEDGIGTVLHSWRGAGDGTFAAAVSLGETEMMDLQVIDVNGDGFLDLVGASYSNRIWVRPGNATGFGAAINTNTDYAVYDLSAGNFNEGSSSIDIVTSSLTSGIFVVYAGNGNGTFTETRRVSAGSADWVTDSTVADVDNDGRFDVALARRMSEKLEVYFRNSDGTFAAPVSMSTGTWPAELAAGDFDHDGLPELVSNNWDDGTIDVFDNLGSRTFSAKHVFDGSRPGSGGGLDSLHLVDIDGDTHLDIMAGSVNGSWLTTWLGAGDGTFAAANWFTAGDDAFSIATGNFDGDADLEVALGSYQQLFTLDYACASQVHFHSLVPVISVGQTARLRAVVSGISATVTGGTVTFKEDSTTLGTAPVGANGIAALDLTGLGAGEHVLHAEFSGNAVLAAATSAEIEQEVTADTSSIAITLGTSLHGEPFNSTVTITGRYGSTTEGWYILTLDGVTESAQRWSGAPLTLALSAGPHTISAEFAGGAGHPPSTSPTYDFTTTKHTVTLTKSGDTTVRAGTAHTIQITLASPTTTPPTGTVTLYRGTTNVGSAAISNGVATIQAVLPRGSYGYSASYAGNAKYLAGEVAFTLNVVANAPVAIDARPLQDAIAIEAVVPEGTTAAALYRRVSGAAVWSLVPGWSLASRIDSSGLTRGVLYDYRLDATVAGQLQQSNVDSTLLFTDPSLTAGSTRVKLAHFTELRDSINALRASAGLAPFVMPTPFGPGTVIRASHLTALRTAATQARSALQMVAVPFTDPTPAGVRIKRNHILELRAATN